MAGTNGADDDKSIPKVVSELKDLTVGYARQETIDPLKNLGRYVGFGVGGSLLLALGLILLGVGLLRLLQTETDGTFDDGWSWAPYLIVTVVVLAFAGLAIMQVRKDGKAGTDGR